MKTNILCTILLLLCSFTNLFAQDDQPQTSTPWVNVVMQNDSYELYVTLECNDSDATIYYTLDGSTPTHSSTVYTEMLKINRNLTVKAIAWTQGGGDSEIMDYTIDYLETPMPEFSQDVNYITITNKLEGASTKYTLDNTDPKTSQSAIVYDGKPLLLTKDCNIMSYSYCDGLKDSYTTSYQFYFSRTQTPWANFNGDILTFESSDENATIYYTLDGTTPSHSSSVYSEPVKLEHNMSIRAMAWTEWGGDSEIYSYEIDWFYVPEPAIEQVGLDYILTNSLEGASTKYTLDGSNPKTSPIAILFDGTPFSISQDATLMAYSYKENFNDSQIVSFSLTAKCPAPYELANDGKYLTLACADAEATIYYSNQNTGQWQTYSVPIELLNINSFSSYAMVESTGVSSDQVMIEPQYYSNSEMVQIREPGLIAKAMEWQPDFESESLKVETLNENWEPFALADSDFEYLRTLKSLKDLELERIANVELPQSAFANMNLRALTLPATLKSFGKNTFSGCDNLSNIEFLGDTQLPSDLFEGKKVNANMLLYVNKADNTKVLPSGTFKTIFKYGDSYRTENLVLDDGYPYYCFKQFFAKEISYTRNFSKTTPLGGSAGWEGLAIPFTPETIKYGDKTLAPFNYGDCDLHFWICTYEQNYWQSYSSIYANKACVVAMPNNEAYLEDYNISGNVTFSATNTYMDPMYYDPNSDSQLKANYDSMEASNDLMVLNDKTYTVDGKTFEPGSVFVAGLRAPRPFEAYIENASGARYMKVGESTGIEGVTLQDGFRVWTEGNEICLASSIDSHVRIFDTTGRLVKTAEVRNGETSRVVGLASGIYIVANRKIYLKK